VNHKTFVTVYMPLSIRFFLLEKPPLGISLSFY